MKIRVKRSYLGFENIVLFRSSLVGFTLIPMPYAKNLSGSRQSHAHARNDRQSMSGSG